jgi:biotin operon repressor
LIYERSQIIERRLETVLPLIRKGRYSTPSLAENVGVSTPTVSRCVNTLHERGNEIRAERHCKGWRYVRSRKTPAVKAEVESQFADAASEHMTRHTKPLNEAGKP